MIEFDRITRLAAAVFDVPIALVSLVDKDRQWFKSCFGISAKETSREASFCTHVVYNRETMLVSDALQDPRFADNPFVVNEPRVRFYAGVRLFLPTEAALARYAWSTLALARLREQMSGCCKIAGSGEN